MATPLTDSINALTNYANDVTGASDTTLSDAVHSLASGYGGGGSDFIVTLSYNSTTENWEPDKALSEIQSAYNNGKTVATKVDENAEGQTFCYFNDEDNTFYYFVDTFNYSTSEFINGYYSLDSIGISKLGANAYITPPTGSLNITTNGTHDVSNYASAVVNVPSSAASSWTKIAETTYQVSTTSTSAATVATWETGHSEIWTTEKILYVRVRDTAGKRAGYFYGSDNFFTGVFLGTADPSGVRFGIHCNNSGAYGKSASNLASGYGVYADTVYDDGRLRIRQRYNSNNSLTIDGTYKVEVYLLDPPTGTTIFE